MTTYLGEKAVGLGTIKATKAVAGDVLHDGTLVGNGNTEPLGVNKQVIATTNQVANLSATLHAAIDTQADAIANTRENSVKKSGDTMTGDLVFDVVNSADIIFQDSTVDTAGNTNSYRKFISAPHQTQGFIFSEIKNGVNKMQFSMVNDGLIMPSGNRLLGSAKYPWEKIYAKKLNNGADVTIPTEGGTLARVEDLESKQDKLTAGENITIEDGVISATGGGSGSSLPDQTGNSGKFLTTDGTAASWGELPDNVLVNKPNGKKSSLVITPDYNGNYGAYNVAIGAGVVDSRNYSVHIGYDSLDSTTTGCSVGIGSKTRTAAFSVAIGYDAEAIAQYSIQIGSGENKDANTLKVSNANGNFEMMSADGTIPADRMSTTAGTTGQVLTKTDTGMEWQDATGGSGGELPDNVLVNNAEQNTQNIAIYGTATGNTVGLISIGYGSKATSLYNLTDVIALGRNATAKNGESIAIGGNSGALTNRTVAIGRSAQASAEHSLALGTYATAKATYCTQLGNGTNNDSNTFKVANSNGNFEMMSADGTIPLERLTKVTDQIGDISTALTAILGE